MPKFSKPLPPSPARVRLRELIVAKAEAAEALADANARIERLGSLAAGVALAVKERLPNARIYTAEPEGFDDHARSFKSGKRERNPAMTGTICDALMAQSPGKLTFEINRSLIGNGVSVSDDDVARAVAFAFRELKLVVEPGGAVGLAALLADKIDVRGKVAVVVLSGGNIDPELFARLVA